LLAAPGEVDTQWQWMSGLTADQWAATTTAEAQDRPFPRVGAVAAGPDADGTMFLFGQHKHTLTHACTHKQ